MISEADAKQAALELARTLYAPLRAGDEIVIDDQRTQRGAVGWVFWPESRHYLETEQYDCSLPFVQAIFVHQASGRASSIAGNAPTDFEVLGSPGHDWPTRAWIAVPLAVVAQAMVWFGAWLSFDFITRVLDIEAVPVSLLGIVLLGLFAISPTVTAIRWANFVNAHPRLGLWIVLAGSLLGELSVSAHFINRILPWPDFATALLIVPEFYGLQSWTYLAFHAAALTVMLAAASQIGNDRITSKALWRGDGD